MERDLIGAYFKLGKFAESGRERGNKFRFKLRFYFTAPEFAAYISAYVCVEKYRVCYSVRINTGASNRNVYIKTDPAVNNSERDRIFCSELVVNKFFGVKIIYSLIFSGVSAVGKTFADGFKGFENRASEVSGENGRFRGRIESEFAGFGANFNDLARSTIIMH